MGVSKQAGMRQGEGTGHQSYIEKYMQLRIQREKEIDQYHMVSAKNITYK